jgi:hypothetical protein
MRFLDRILGRAEATVPVPPEVVSAAVIPADRPQRKLPLVRAAIENREVRQARRDHQDVTLLSG